MRDLMTEIGQNSIELKGQEEDLRKYNSELLFDLSNCSKFLMKKFDIGISDIDMAIPFTIPLQSPFKIKKIMNDLETYKTHCMNFSKINEKEKDENENEKRAKNSLNQSSPGKKRKIIRIKDYVYNKTTQKNKIISYINRSIDNTKYLILNKGQKIPKVKRDFDTTLENDNCKSSICIIRSSFQNSYDSSMTLSQAPINRKANLSEISDKNKKKKKRKIFNINLSILPIKLDEIEGRIKKNESNFTTGKQHLTKGVQRSRKSKSLEKLRINYQSIKNTCNEIYGNLKNQLSKFEDSNNKTPYDLKFH